MRAQAAAVAACVLAAGCGGSDERVSTPTPTPSPATLARPEAEPGGAGDEQPIRQPVRLTVSGDGITPSLVKVSAFLGVELIVRNASSRTQVVTVLRVRPRRALTVEAGATRRLRLAGLRRGRYRIQSAAGARATLVSSLDEP
jgi:hypothetical protein